jgi:small conductance mechanosensitive channel
MKQSVFSALLMLALLTGPTAAGAIQQQAGLLNAPAQKEREARGMGTAELEAVLLVLEDPEAARKMAESLRSLMEARKEQDAPERKEEREGEEKEPEQTVPTPLSRVFESYKSYEGRALSALTKVRGEISGLDARYRNLKTYLSRQENRRVLYVFLVQFAVALLAGLGTWLGLRRLTQRWGEGLRRRESHGLGRRIGRAFLAAALPLCPWAGLFLFTALFFLFFPHLDRFRRLLLEAILALGLYSGLKSFAQVLFSPAAPERRILPLDDGPAAYAYVWTRRVLVFTLWMALMIMAGTVYGFPAWTSVCDAVLKTGLVLMAAVVLAQQREAIQHRLGLGVDERDSPWKARSKRIAGYVLGKLYILAVLYMGLVIALAALGFQDAYRYMMRASGRSLLVVLIAGAAVFLWRLLFKKLFQVSRGLRERYPDLEAQVNRYVNLLEDGGHLLILLFASVSLLEAWGLNIYAFLSTHGFFVRILLQIPLVILGAVLLIQIGRLLITALEKEVALRMLAARSTSPGEAEKRVSTLGRICRSALYVITISIAGMMVLDRIGLDIKPILAGAGIIGLAVGFGAQNLVKDIISGLFFIIENRIRVGDVAILNGTGGLVEQVNLRTTVLRSLDGVIHVFPNGSITSLSNMTHEFSYYLFNVGVAYKEDTDRVSEVLKAVGAEMLEDNDFKEYILEPLEILGVDEFADSAVVIKARIKTVPIKQWAVGREMNRRIKKRFDEEGIEIPFPHRTFYFGEESKSIAVALQGQKEDREALKDLLREVLEESREVSV